MMARSVAGLALVAMVLSAALSASCAPPTQIVLEIDAEGGCERVQGVAAWTSREGEALGAPKADQPSACGHAVPGANVGTLVVTPGSASPIVVTVMAGVDGPVSECSTRPERCIVARRKLGFITRQSLRLPIALDVACKGVECDPASSCYRGSCVPLNAIDCVDGVCTPREDAGVPPPVRDGGPCTPVTAVRIAQTSAAQIPRVIAAGSGIALAYLGDDGLLHIGRADAEGKSPSPHLSFANLGAKGRVHALGTEGTELAVVYEISDSQAHTLSRYTGGMAVYSEDVPGTQAGAGLVHSGLGYGYVHVESGTPMLRFVPTMGLSASTPFAAGVITSPSVERLGTGFVIAWQGGNGCAVGQASQAGVVSMGSNPILSPCGSPRLASRGTSALLVYLGQGTVVAREVTAALTLGPNRVVATEAALWPTAIPTPSGYRVFWTLAGGQFRSVPVAPDGTPTGIVEPFLLGAAIGERFTPVPLADGGWGIAWHDPMGPSGPGIYWRRSCP